MRVFISWSGEQSREVAELLDTWINCVIQATRPWISTHNIDNGSIWFTEIHSALAESKIGIVVLTKENKEKPWLLFEAGAMFKGISTNRVFTFLVDMKPTDIEDPLAQFHHTIYSKSSIQKLFENINSLLDKDAIRREILVESFEAFWKKYDKKYQDIIKKSPRQAKEPPRSEASILSEILDNTRSLKLRVNALESRSSEASADFPIKSKRASNWIRSRQMQNDSMIKAAIDCKISGLSLNETIDYLKRVEPDVPEDAIITIANQTYK